MVCSLLTSLTIYRFFRFDLMIILTITMINRLMDSVGGKPVAYLQSVVNLPLVSPITNPFSSPSRGYQPGSSIFKSPTLTTEPRCLQLLAVIVMIDHVNVFEIYDFVIFSALEGKCFTCQHPKAYSGQVSC